MKYILIGLLILFPITLSDTTTHKCSDKELLDSNYHLVNSAVSDVTLAYNEVGSCISLEADEKDSQICCYMKIKFKNELLDERFTHKGCHSVSTSYLLEEATSDIDDYIEDLEENRDYYYATDEDGDNYQIVYKSVSIDCNSKYLAIGFGLLLLFL